MPSADLLSRIEAAKRAVVSQTDLLHREFGRVESRWKSDGTRVTAADLAISENIVKDLSGSFPGDQYLSEELAESGGPRPVTARFSWILDPIDGTNNYALGIPHCAISLALLENGEPVYGVVYDLSRRTLMHGGPGFGVHDGARPGRVSEAAQGADRFVGFHSPSDKALLSRAGRVHAEFKIRELGSATLHLAYVAVGILDGVVETNVKIWDLAAAIPMCRAGGGLVRFLNGEQLPVRSFDLNMKRIVYVAGNPAICKRLAALIAG
jgi:myo-inositol-1(or 4)-monophosphatase